MNLAFEILAMSGAILVLALLATMVISIIRDEFF